jgi:hypothetical protein
MMKLQMTIYFQVTVEADLEHPFFVFGQGWSSACPDRTLARYNLGCLELKVGDVCISLTHRLTPATPQPQPPPAAAAITTKAKEEEEPAEEKVAVVKEESAAASSSSSSPSSMPPPPRLKSLSPPQPMTTKEEEEEEEKEEEEGEGLQQQRVTYPADDISSLSLS